MGRHEHAIDPEHGPVQRFALDLRRLRSAAGRPTYRELARQAGYSVTVLSQAASGKRLPTLPVALAYAMACGGDQASWQRHWEDAAAEVAAGPEPCGDGRCRCRVPAAQASPPSGSSTRCSAERRADGGVLE